MRAYKVLGDGRSRFTGWPWPLPDGDQPGEWVAADGPPALCRSGVHACTVDQLPQWLGDELWVIELGGEILRTESALVAGRGRLLGPVVAWDEGARRAFAAACARRARDLSTAAPSPPVLPKAIERFASLGLAAPAGYWTAVLAGERIAGRRAGDEYDAAFAQERSRQARWLQSALGPPDPTAA